MYYNGRNNRVQKNIALILGFCVGYIHHSELSPLDSLTQIVLGAATGEAVAGKKIGNRAMLWGAVGGTIPDLDVLANLFTDEITALAFHRGFMHSLLFAALAPWFLGWLTHRFYESGVYRKKGYKIGAMLVWVLFYLLAAVAINAIPIMLDKGLSPTMLAITLLPLVYIGWRLYTRYYKNSLAIVNMPYSTWVLLFFVSIVTHPILDCFTGYGTQIFAPFSDVRIEWGTIFVADPLYTVPFALCLYSASTMKKENPKRAWVNWAGILISSAYLAFTVYHKLEVNKVFEKSLQAQSVDYQRFTSGPTPLNNVVWSCMAETDSSYYFGMWGFNDGSELAEKFIPIPKNHDLLGPVPSDDPTLQVLQWFSNGYYNVVERPDGKLQFNDLRFGLMGDTLRNHQSYVFPFLINIENGRLEATHIREIDDKESRKVMQKLWKRIWGDL